MTDVSNYRGEKKKKAAVVLPETWRKGGRPWRRGGGRRGKKGEKKDRETRRPWPSTADIKSKYLSGEERERERKAHSYCPSSSSWVYRETHGCVCGCSRCSIDLLLQRKGQETPTAETPRRIGGGKRERKTRQRWTIPISSRQELQTWEFFVFSSSPREIEALLYFVPLLSFTSWNGEEEERKFTKERKRKTTRRRNREEDVIQPQASGVCRDRTTSDSSSFSQLCRDVKLERRREKASKTRN